MPNWTNKDLRLWYRKLNTQFFSGKLPEDIKISYGNCHCNDANAWYDSGSHKIVLDRSLASVGQLQVVILLHEMVHVELEMGGYCGYPGDGGHGMMFQARLKRLWEQGAYDGII